MCNCMKLSACVTCFHRGAGGASTGNSLTSKPFASHWDEVYLLVCSISFIKKALVSEVLHYICNEYRCDGSLVFPDKTYQLQMSK